jgi:hypothetical protein
MPTHLFRPLLIALIAVAALSTPAYSTVIFIYDFPGGSGLAASQTNGQPSGATFSDFTRTNLNAAVNPGAFASTKWNTGGSIDPSEFLSFSITASVGQYLNLASLTFDDFIGSPTGPANMQVALYLNGSSTAYATMNFNPTTSLASENFDFADLTDADLVTSATFKFFGWNAVGPAGEFDIDNVATGITNAPEVGTSLFTLLPIGLALYSLGRRLTGKAPPAPPTKATS